MTGGSRIDCRAAPPVVLGHMRHAPLFPATGHEVGGIIVLVGSDGSSPAGIVFDHVESSLTLGRAVGLSQSRIDDQAVVVLHHDVAHMTELGLLARTLAE